MKEEKKTFFDTYEIGKQNISFRFFLWYYWAKIAISKSADDLTAIMDSQLQLDKLQLYK